MELGGPATAAAYAEVGKTLIFGLQDGRLQFIKREGFVVKAQPKLHQKGIKKIIYLENTGETAVCDISGQVSVWKTLTVEDAEIRRESEIAKQQSLFQQGGYKTGMMMND